MKFLKDFFYDKNDIVLTIVILVLAGLLISWRLDVIMEYPSSLAKETHTTETSQEVSMEEKENSEEDAPGQMPLDSIWDDGVLTQEVAVTIQPASEKEAVGALVYAGLFQSYDEFVKICKKAGCKPSQIKASSYRFPVGSTQKDIAIEVTKP